MLKVSMQTTSQPIPSPDAQETSSSDDMLMKKLFDGDANALLEIYDRHSALVFTVACHVVRNVHTAEDISQEVFLQLWRKPKSFDAQRGALRTWLGVITRHRAIDYIRKQRKELSVDYQYLPGFDKSINCDGCDWINLIRVHSILQQVPVEQREIFELAYFGGLTQTEIAARTGTPLGTVKTRIRSVLKNMREILTNVGRAAEDGKKPQFSSPGFNTTCNSDHTAPTQ